MSVIDSIRWAISGLPIGARGETIARTVRTQLGRDGYTLVQKSKKQRLEKLLDTVYVDRRKTNAVNALEEARKLVKSL